MKSAYPKLLAAQLLAPLAALHAADQPANKPNILFILTDDCGWSDTTLYGTTRLYETPNIERLAKRGSAYRFHDTDPVFFQTGLRLTCRCGEELNGRKLHDLPDTRFTTYTSVYQW